MEKNSQELLEELVARLAEVRGQLDVIQSKVDELMNLKEIGRASCRERV